MKVALIGGTGFVGSYLIDELISNEHTPRLLVRKNSEDKVIQSDKCEIIKGDAVGNLDRDGRSLNTTNRLIAMVNKLFNKAPTVLDDIKFGIVNKPLIEFTDAFESGLVNAGDYINGELVDSAINTSNLDASTYGPDTAQDTVIDAGLYLNVES